MSTIEIELRTFLEDHEYDRIAALLEKEGQWLRDHEEETIYLTGEQDLRLRKTEDKAFAILKKGQLHDDAREELEVEVKRDDFEQLALLFSSLGYEREIHWFRERRVFQWGKFTVFLDDTRGYGKILEIEYLSDNDDKAIRDEMKQVMNRDFGVTISDKKEFEERFAHYKEHWKELL